MYFNAASLPFKTPNSKHVDGLAERCSLSLSMSCGSDTLLKMSWQMFQALAMVFQQRRVMSALDEDGETQMDM